MRFSHAIVHRPRLSLPGSSPPAWGLLTWRSRSSSTRPIAKCWSVWGSRSSGSCRTQRFPTAPDHAEGAAQVTAWLEQRGFGSSVIDIRRMPRLLHLKTGLSWLGGRRLLAADEVAGHAALGGWEVVRVPDGEAYAANCLMINDVVLIAQGCPGTASLLGKLGYEVVALGMSEYRKMNGGLSCLSVRW